MKVRILLMKGEEVLRFEERIYDEDDEKEANTDFKLLSAILAKKGRVG